MKHFNRKHMAIISLLSVMSFGPLVLNKQQPQRSIASFESIDEELQKRGNYPRYEALAEKLKADLPEKSAEADQDEIKQKKSKLIERLQATSDFKTEGDKKLSEEERAEIESIVKDVIELESLDPLAEDELIEAKSSIECLLTEEEKASTEVAECACEGKNSPLTTQVEQLVSEQNKIMQTVLSMAQMMMSMLQNQQQQYMPNPYHMGGQPFQFQNPYVYNPPFSPGNWVYQPAAFSSPQGNIFAAQAPVSAPAPAAEPQWNLKPQMDFTHEERTLTPEMPLGIFGASDAMSFDMTNSVPTVSQR